MLVDDHALRSLLRFSLDIEQADRLLGYLRSLPSCAFRETHRWGDHTEEVPWFRLAEDVVVFDPSPSATFEQLQRPVGPTPESLVAAVHKRFPSVYEEFLVTDGIPPRIRGLLASESAPELEALLRELLRQLGWWAAFATSLIVPAALLAATDSDPLAPNAWPLGMYVLAAALGGWTLTVVGGCMLAPYP